MAKPSSINNYSYKWFDAEKTAVIRTDTDGIVAAIPADPENTDYSEFLSSGATAADYVEPSATTT